MNNCLCNVFDNNNWRLLIPFSPVSGGPLLARGSSFLHIGKLTSFFRGMSGYFSCNLNEICSR